MNPAKITHLSLTSKLRRFDRFTINIFLKKRKIFFLKKTMKNGFWG
jgi:hypothetical protein